MLRVQPVSGDLLVKIGLGVVAAGVAWFMLKKAKKGLESALGLPNVSTAMTENGVETFDPRILHKLRQLSDVTP